MATPSDTGQSKAIPEPEPLSFSGALESSVNTVQGWAVTVLELLPNILVALLVVALFWVMGRVAGRLLRRALQRTSRNEQISALLSTMLRFGVVAVGFFVALGLLQLDKALTSLLAGVGIVGLALGFAFQDIAANLMSGIIMAVRQPFQNGQTVETLGHTGTVERVTLRATVLRLFTGQLAIIPNKDVLQSTVVNYSETGERRVDIPVGIGYGDDIQAAKRVAIEAIESIDYRDPGRDVEVYCEEFGGSSINLSVRFWIDLGSEHSNFLEARSRAVEAIKTSFDDAGISIPFPIRTLDLEDAEASLTQIARSLGEGGEG